MKRKHKRLLGMVATCLITGLGTAIVLMQLRDHVVFYVSPSELYQRTELAGQVVRVGGLVEPGSVEQKTVLRPGHAPIIQTAFSLTDWTRTVVIHYQGTLPALFRDGQGVVAQGQWRPSGVVHASTLLTKHDERYRPPDIPKRPA